MNQKTVNFSIGEDFGDLLRDMVFEKFIESGFDEAKLFLETIMIGSGIDDELVSKLIMGDIKFVVENDELFVREDNESKYKENLQVSIDMRNEDIKYFASSDFVYDMKDMQPRVEEAGYKAHKYKVKHSKRTERNIVDFFDEVSDRIYRKISLLLNTIGRLEEYYKFRKMTSGYNPALDKKLHVISELQKEIDWFKELVNNGFVGIDEYSINDFARIKDMFYHYFILNFTDKKNINKDDDTGWLLPNGIYFGMIGDSSRLAHVNLADAYKRFFNGENVEKDSRVIKIKLDTVITYNQTFTNEQVNFLYELSKKYKDGLLFDSGVVKSLRISTEELNVMDYKELNLRVNNYLNDF